MHACTGTSGPAPAILDPGGNTPPPHGHTFGIRKDAAFGDVATGFIQEENISSLQPSPELSLRKQTRCPSIFWGVTGSRCGGDKQVLAESLPFGGGFTLKRAGRTFPLVIGGMLVPASQDEPITTKRSLGLR